MDNENEISSLTMRIFLNKINEILVATDYQSLTDRLTELLKCLADVEEQQICWTTPEAAVGKVTKPCGKFFTFYNVLYIKNCRMKETDMTIGDKITEISSFLEQYFEIIKDGHKTAQNYHLDNMILESGCQLIDGHIDEEMDK
uniref:DUF4954 family protein n=1 Tax=Rhabditophanes sp. KR3021 TaxID=114890 RepID=A0AC35U5Y9_9BILA